MGPLSSPCNWGLSTPSPLGLGVHWLRAPHFGVCPQHRPFVPLPTWRLEAVEPRAEAPLPAWLRALGAVPHLTWRLGGRSSVPAGYRAGRGRRGRATPSGDAAAAAGRRDGRAEPWRSRPSGRSPAPLPTWRRRCPGSPCRSREKGG